MVDTLNAQSSNSSLLNENVPLLSSDQPMPSQPNPMQTFLCTNVLNQPTENPTIVSLLQGNVQNGVNSQESLASSLSMTSAHHHAKRDRTNQFYPQQTFVSKSFDESNFSPQHMAQKNSSVQVPLQTVPQGQIASSVISNTNDGKTAKHPLFFSVSLGQLNQNGNFKVPAQITSGNIFQPSNGQQQSANTETQAFRRHSYTTGQHLQSTPLSSGDYMGTRRSRAIAPAGNFAVPEIPVSLFF